MNWCFYLLIFKSMRFVTRREIADELRVCTATFDNWRREYELEKGKRFQFNRLILILF